jgi:acyl carrier protein
MLHGGFVEDPAIFGSLKKFIEDQLIDGPGIAIEPETPLLEWGILNSLATASLVAFIRDNLGVEVPIEQMVGENFRNLANITRMVADLATSYEKA